MTVFAPSDFVETTIPADPQVGGCGQRHRRPEGPDGQPVQPWGLSCDGGCEDYLLAHDDRWVKDLHDIKPTFDETKAAERFEREGSRQQSAIMTAAIAQLAGFSPAQIPPHLQRAISGLKPHVPLTGSVVCPAGHGQAAGMKFCGECGEPMSSPVPAAAVTPGSAA